MIKEIKGLPAAWLDTTVYWIISICRQCISFENNIVFEKRFYHFNAFNENSIWYESLKTSSEIQIQLMAFFNFCPPLPPTHTPPSPSNTFLLCFTANYFSKEQFISIFRISSIPPKITSLNSLSLRERWGGPEKDSYSISPSLSFSVCFSHFRCILHFVKAYGNGRGADGDLVPRAVQMTYE